MGRLDGIHSNSTISDCSDSFTRDQRLQQMESYTADDYITGHRAKYYRYVVETTLTENLWWDTP